MSGEERVLAPSSPPWHPAALLAALGGPLALGAALGLPLGLRASLTGALALPGILLGVGLLMMPALYIGASLQGVAPPAASVVRAAGQALRSAGILLLGLTPPTAFVLVTGRTSWLVPVLGGLVVGCAVFCGLRLLFTELFHRHGTHLRALPLFLVWALVALVIGSRLFWTTLSPSLF